MKRIAEQQPKMLRPFRHLCLRIRQAKRLVTVAAERDHHAYGPLCYHLNRYEFALREILAGSRESQ